MNDITATVLQRLSVISRAYVQVSVFIGSTIFRPSIALSRNANRIESRKEENALRSIGFFDVAVVGINRERLLFRRTRARARVKRSGERSGKRKKRERKWRKNGEKKYEKERKCTLIPGRIPEQSRYEIAWTNSAWKVQQLGHASCNINYPLP